jgi:hypothetical protein
MTTRKWLARKIVIKRWVTAMATVILHVHVRRIFAVMTVIPTCSCPWSGYLRWLQLYQHVPVHEVDICGDDSYTNMFMSCGYLQWLQLYQHVHVRWISAVMTAIPTCSCLVDICSDYSYTNMFMSMKWISAVLTVIPTCSWPVAGVRILLVEDCNSLRRHDSCHGRLTRMWRKLLHLMDTEDRGTALLRNVGNYLPIDTSWHARRLWEPQIWHYFDKGNLLLKVGKQLWGHANV